MFAIRIFYRAARIVFPSACVLLVGFGVVHGQAVPPTKTPITENGLVADWYVPARTASRPPAIIVLGGSEGGMGPGAAIEASLIAARGLKRLVARAVPRRTPTLREKAVGRRRFRFLDIALKP
jgi:hypothetical protein